MKKLVLMAGVALIALMDNTRAEACLVKDPSGTLNVRSSPEGLVVGALKNGTLVVIEERRGDWVSHAPFEEVRKAGVGPIHPPGLRLRRRQVPQGRATGQDARAIRR